MIVGYEDLKWLERVRGRNGSIYFKDVVEGIKAKLCNKCETIKYIESFPDKYENCRKCIYDRRKEMFDNNPEKYLPAIMNRRFRESYLEDSLTEDELASMYSRFNYSCAITMDKTTLNIDHVIPYTVGREGNSLGNIIPLRRDLNISKSDRNIFEWFADNRERFGLSQRKFDELIEYLADINEMTVEDYREYVYWCHDNPRTIDEIKAEETSDDEAS